MLYFVFVRAKREANVSSSSERDAQGKGKGCARQEFFKDNRDNFFICCGCYSFSIKELSLLSLLSLKPPQEGMLYFVFARAPSCLSRP